MTDTTMMTAGATPSPAPASTQTDTSATVAPVEGQSPPPAADAPGQAPAAPETLEAPEGAPEKYAFTLPEGAVMDDAGIASFGEFAKELNLTQEAAQAMLGKLAPAMQARQAQARGETMAQWETQSKTDKEFGGAKLTENIAVAQKALAQFGSPELNTLLRESGLGNHPEIIRAFYRAGKAIGEDTFVSGERKSNTAQSPAQRMYPNMNP